jgi:hypothetical protein
MIICLFLLNLFDYLLTLLNRGNFEEANPLTRPIIDNTLALTLLKLVLVPLCVYVLWRYKDKSIVKIASNLFRRNTYACYFFCKQTCAKIGDW